MLAGTACLVLLLSACGGGGDGGGGQADTQLQDVPAPLAAQLDMFHQAVKAAGQTEVVVYGSGVGSMNEVWNAFQKRYPDVRVRTQDLVGAPLVTKLQQEAASNQHTADLINTAGSVHQQFFKAGYYAPLEKPAGVTSSDVGARELGGNCLAPFGTAFSMAFNPDKLPADQAPKAWSDLIDPKWKGKIALADPGTINATTGTLAVLKANGVVDDAWLTALMAQNLVVVPGAEQVNGTLVSGQAQIALTSLQNVANDKAKGASLDFLFPYGGGSYLNGQVSCLMKTAPHPEAAKLLHAWMFTPEAQEAAARQGSYPFVAGSAAPSGLPSIDQVPNLVSVPQDQAATANAAMAAQLRGLLGR
ncbi:MAG: hypothetical protein ABS81_10235 [Pseudonocardia sp. SCN 72-86]|nr:MAG: hypothetical protein ABS81_10235 [Pseudonocardia sp. SCN 72-86]